MANVQNSRNAIEEADSRASVRWSALPRRTCDITRPNTAQIELHGKKMIPSVSDRSVASTYRLLVKGRNVDVALAPSSQIFGFRIWSSAASPNVMGCSIERFPACVGCDVYSLW